jgi:hypothetical protein
MAWWDVLLEFLLGTLTQGGYVLSVQFFNLNVLWQLLPIYTGWFAIQFITIGKEGEEISDRFMNGFALLWVGFQLGEYIIGNFALNLEMIIKTLAVGGIFAYAFFIMRLTLRNKDISKYLARIGEISAINIAAMLFIQDLLIISSGLQLAQLIIAFVLIYGLLDYGIIRLVDYLHKRLKLPITAKPEVPTPAPRYERITTPPAKPVTPPMRPPTRPVTPPARPTPPTARPPIATPRPTIPARPTTPPTAPPKKPVRREGTE